MIPPQLSPGRCPDLEVALKISWGFAGYLLGCIAIVHCVLSALAFVVNWKNKRLLNEGEVIEI